MQEQRRTIALLKSERLDPDLPVLESIARHYLSTSQCPRFMQREKVDGRWQLVRDLCAEYHAQGVLYEQLKFCEYWGYERALASHVVTREFGIPSGSGSGPGGLGGTFGAAPPDDEGSPF